jgi:fluoride exporter
VRDAQALAAPSEEAPGPRISRGPGRRQHFAIAIGGVLGAYARIGLAEGWPAGPHGWPWPTFVVNLVGAFILGYVATRFTERLPPSTYPRPLLGTGLCGALTTFSTLQIELIELARGGRPALAVAYGAATLVAGLAAVVLSTGLVRRGRTWS